MTLTQRLTKLIIVRGQLIKDRAEKIRKHENHSVIDWKLRNVTTAIIDTEIKLEKRSAA